MRGTSADPALQKAMQACASLRPKFGGPGRGGFDSSAMKAFTGCLEDHGVVLPSASPGMQPRDFSTSDPKAAAAFKICKVLLPQRPRDGVPSAGPTA
ncbi:hypothetical protein ABZV67_44920 [Streptomyces sp. NPDC005065]|uniref:hypothetical protein n=1 Tax=Streptomyces sp. NPDC005065 TaxID=3154461 RepID=UPI0033A52EF9